MTGQPPQVRPTVTCCMIAGGQSDGAQRQLELRLPKALQSVAPWVDEIVVVDTGCGPDAASILARFAEECETHAVRFVLAHHPWEHDFAAHRNQAFSYAKSDWVLVLDTDEELDQRTAKSLWQLGDMDEQTAALHAVVSNHLPDGRSILMQPRLFRRGRVHYTQAVHNVPVVDGGNETSTLSIIHHGYNESPVVMDAKHERRKAMCGAWVEQEPSNSIAWAYLARTLLARRETVPEAVEAAERAYALHVESDGNPVRLPHILYPLFSGCAVLGRDDEALAHAQVCVDAHPLHPDAYYYAAVVFYRQKRWAEAFHTAGRFMELQARARVKPEIFVTSENMTFSRTEEALAMLGRAMVELE